MMAQEEIRRIMNLVKEGKLSPDDAMELLEAFNAPSAEESANGQATPPPPPPQSPPPPPPPPKNPGQELFQSILDSIEHVGRAATQNVNWNEVSAQVKENLKKGSEELRAVIESAKSGNFVGIRFGGHASRTVTLPLTWHEGMNLKLESADGSIRVLSGQPVDQIIAKGTFFGSGDSAQLQAKADAFTPIIEESEGFVTIRQPEQPGLSVDYEVHLTAPGSVETRSKNGDISIDGAQGSVRVFSKSGDVVIQNAKATIDVETYNGDVMLSSSESANIVIETKNGDLSLADTVGPFNLKTVAGDVDVKRAKARTVSIEAISGDVTLDLSDPITGVVNVRTVHGDTLVTIEDACDCRVSLATLQGGVDSLVDLQDVNRSEKRLTGRLGDGNGSLDVSAVSGDVRLRQRLH